MRGKELMTYIKMKIKRKFNKEIDIGNHDRELCFEKRNCNGDGFIGGYPCVCSCHADLFRRNSQEEQIELLTKLTT